MLGKLTGKHLWWSLFSGFRSATLVKKILMNKPFSVNGCKHLCLASTSQSNLRMSGILFVLLYIRYKEHVKRFKGVPLITSSSQPSTATSNTSISWHFFQFFVLLTVKSWMHLQVRHRVPPHVHLLWNCFVNSFALTSAPPCSSSNVTQLQPKAHS